MTKVVQIPRHTTGEVDILVLLAGNLRMDTNRKELRLGDGTTPGGVRFLNLDQLNSVFLRKDEGLGPDVGFPAEGVGMLVRVSEETFVVRILTVGDGLDIENADGVSGNPEISVDEDWLEGFLDDLYATRTNILANAADKILRVQEAWSSLTYTSLTFGSTVAIDFALGVNFVLSATGACTLGNPTNVKWQSGDIEILAVGNDRVISFGSNWQLPIGIPSITVPEDTRTILSYSVNSLGEPTLNGFTQYG